MQVPMEQDKNKMAFIAIAIGVTLVLVLVCIYIVVGRFSAQKELAAVSAGTQATGSEGIRRGPAVDISTDNQNVANIARAVARHAYLPSGNVTVATVQNPDDLRKQNPLFYQYAKKGDIVLVYPDRAILYNPDVDRVIDIIHMQVPSQTQQASPSGKK